MYYLTINSCYIVSFYRYSPDILGSWIFKNADPAVLQPSWLRNLQQDHIASMLLPRSWSSHFSKDHLAPIPWCREQLQSFLSPITMWSLESWLHWCTSTPLSVNFFRFFLFGLELFSHNYSCCIWTQIEDIQAFDTAAHCGSPLHRTISWILKPHPLLFQS